MLPAGQPGPDGRTFTFPIYADAFDLIFDPPQKVEPQTKVKPPTLVERLEQLERWKKTHEREHERNLA